MFSAFLGAKIHFFQKVLKKWSSIQKNRKYFYHFLGGEGVRPQSEAFPKFCWRCLSKTLLYLVTSQSKFKGNQTFHPTSQLGLTFPLLLIFYRKRRKKSRPSPIALEPCAGNRAAVLSLVVRMPTGGHSFAPPGTPGKPLQLESPCFKLHDQNSINNISHCHSKSFSIRNIRWGGVIIIEFWNFDPIPWEMIQ